MLNTIDKNRAFGTIIGLAIGEAFANPMENQMAVFGTGQEREMTGGGYMNLKAGEWGANTTGCLLLIDTLIECNDFYPHNFINRLGEWVCDGTGSVNGKFFGATAAVTEAVRKFKSCGMINNVTTPCYIYSHSDPSAFARVGAICIFSGEHERAFYLVDQQCVITHLEPRIRDACGLLTEYIFSGLLGNGKEVVLRDIPKFKGSYEVQTLAAGKFKTPSKYRFTFQALECFENALRSVFETNSFEDAIIHSAACGKNAMSNTMITGQLAGAIYGYTAIPERWLNKLAWRKGIEERAEKLFAFSQDWYNIRDQKSRKIKKIESRRNLEERINATQGRQRIDIHPDQIMIGYGPHRCGLVRDI